MSGCESPRWQCPQCGYVEPSNDDFPPNFFYRPWHVRSREAVWEYVHSLGEEAHEWLLALYVDDHLQLLAVDTVAQGDVSSCKVSFGHVLCRGRELKATGFILVHNHPSGDPTPSHSDKVVTARLARVSHEMNIPLLDHLIVAGNEMRRVNDTL